MNNKDNPIKPENKPSNPFAFPVADDNHYEPGLTMRDYFAAKAMQGILAGAYSNPTVLVGMVGLTKETGAPFSNEVSERSYRIADAMLKERSSHE